jgi:hypothetical protein
MRPCRIFGIIIWILLFLFFSLFRSKGRLDCDILGRGCHSNLCRTGFCGSHENMWNSELFSLSQVSRVDFRVGLRSSFVGEEQSVDSWQSKGVALWFCSFRIKDRVFTSVSEPHYQKFGLNSQSDIYRKVACGSEKNCFPMDKKFYTLFQSWIRSMQKFNPCLSQLEQQHSETPGSFPVEDCDTPYWRVNCIYGHVTYVPTAASPVYQNQFSVQWKVLIEADKVLNCNGLHLRPTMQAKQKIKGHILN